MVVSKKIIYPFLLASLLLASCFSLHKGSISNSVAINGPNFIFLQQNVSGRSSATYVLGIGGMGRESLIAAAKEDLTRKYPLKRAQAYSNYTVNFKTSVYLGLVITVDCFLSADIVEFTEAGAMPGEFPRMPLPQDTAMSPGLGRTGASAILPVDSNYIDRRGIAFERLNTDGLALVFRDNEVGLKYYAYDYYLVKKLWQKKSLNYTEAQAILHDNDDLKGFFMPSISELKRFYDGKRMSTSIPDGIFWSQNEQDENNVLCWNMKTGEVVVMNKSESCMLLPLVAVKGPH